MPQYHQSTIQQFYALLEEKNLNDWIMLWAKGGEMAFPFSNNIISTSLSGKKIIKRFWIDLFLQYARFSLSLQEVFIHKNKAAVFFESQYLLKHSEQYQKTKHVGLFEFDKVGQIKRYTEFSDPFQLLKTFKLVR